METLTRVDAAPASALGVIVPHGSYRHAGAIVGSTLARVAIPRRCVVVGASHTGSWMPWSLMDHGACRTPLGDVPVDEPFAAALRARCPFLSTDDWTQRGEHAIEVLLPFLQRLGPSDLAVVPLVVSADDRQELVQCAEALAQVVRMHEEPVLLIASSDLSHYEPHARAAACDRALIGAACRLDSDGFIRHVHDEAVLMCGVGAVACVLDAASALGARRGDLVKYGTSAEAGGDRDSVIGYAGIVIR